MTTWAWLVVCIGGWGIGVFLMKIAADRIGPVTAVVFNLPGYLLAGLWLIPKSCWGVSPGHLAAVAVGVCFIVANFAFYKLAQTKTIAVLSVLAGLYVAIPLLLGLLILHERPRPVQWAGIVLALVALVLLTWPVSVGSSRPGS